MVSLLIVIVLSYLLGSFPTAILASRLIMKDDIRKHGSGNAGATNVFRVMGWKPALIVVLVDIGKGTAAVLLISRIAAGAPLEMPLVRMLAGVAAIAGHIWTVFAGFKGGKGVGTAFGVLVALAPLASIVTLVIWVILVLTTRIVSVGSLAAGVVFPMTLLIQRFLFDLEIHSAYLFLGIGLGVLIFITHRTNIRRLLRGEENRFGKRREHA
jgi:glycerol-3-phosphate acyltransferase PlsY